MTTSQFIRFPHTWLSNIHGDLLSDLSREQFCMLLGKKQKFTGGFCINVIEVLNPGPEAYLSHSLCHVKPRKDFVLYALSEVQDRLDVDTIIDIHTHPFAATDVHFSKIDDKGEVQFLKFVNEHFDGINYASIVLSQSQYAARFWDIRNGKEAQSPLLLRTPTQAESLKSSLSCLKTSSGLKHGCKSTGLRWWSNPPVLRDMGGFARLARHVFPRAENTPRFLKQLLKDEGQPANDRENNSIDDEFFSRTVLAIGAENLRSIVGSSAIIIVGLGGLGSVIAENLVHMGFENFILVDHDVVEKSNLNRIVGATWEDAEKSKPKVEVVSKHLQSIRPSIKVRCEKAKIEDLSIDSEIASSDWMILATDSHSSRFYAQELAFRFFIPMISAGVGIAVEDGAITDYSGEVIVIRPGDKLCLNCLNRLNPIKIAAERGQEKEKGRGRSAEIQLQGESVDGPNVDVLKGYVRGALIHDPAVKTLNSVIGALTVEQLVNQFTQRSLHEPVLVYERNLRTSIFPDQESIDRRNKHCFTCSIG